VRLVKWSFPPGGKDHLTNLTGLGGGVRARMRVW